MDMQVDFGDGETNLLKFLAERFKDVNGFKLIDIANNGKIIKSFEVAGRIFGETTPVKFILESLDSRVREYGGRVNRANETEGIDWKSISHAIRVFQQIVEYVETKTISFPRPNTWFLTEVKSGCPTVGSEFAFEILRQLDAQVLGFDVAVPDLAKLPELEDEIFKFIENRIG